MSYVEGNAIGPMTGGPGGDGSGGGGGGTGGAGGDGQDNGMGQAGHGGDGGAGGSGGVGGTAGPGGIAYGLYGVASGAASLVRFDGNVVYVVDGGPAGDAGPGGDGGQGGAGGTGGTGASNGDGADGGTGGSAGDGGAGESGGGGLGVLLAAETSIWNSFLGSISGGNGAGGGHGGTGGTGGDGGVAGGAGGSTGQGGDGGSGGTGGHGGGIGKGYGVLLGADSALVNSTINEVTAAAAGVMVGGGVGPGGDAGKDGDGGTSAWDGLNGGSGSAGSPGYGYGVYIASGIQPQIINSIIAYATDGASSSALEYGICSVDILPTSPIRDFNDVYNWDTNYHNVSPGTHDINQDPHFVDNRTDLHLRPASPCLDVGDDGTASGMSLPDYDADGDLRPFGTSWDIGADEYVPTPPVTVTITGPTQGRIATAYAFTATVRPTSTAQPLTYTWQASDQAVVTHTNGLSDTAVFTWAAGGTKTITATVANGGGSETGMRTIRLSGYRLYLPLILR